MSKSFTRVGLLLVASLLSLVGFAQSWPVQLTLRNGDMVKLYEPQPESYEQSRLVFRSAISLIKKGESEPVFGTLWANSQTRSEQSSGNISLESLSITDIRFPASITEETTREIEVELESGVPARKAIISSSYLENALSRNKEKQQLDASFSNKAPKVIYTTTPSLLVVIDGEPVLQKNQEWGMEAVVNSPNTIVKNNDGNFYLYGGNRWYKSQSAKGPFNYTGYPPANLAAVEKAVKKGESSEKEFDSDFDNANINRAVIVSTEPAELIQSEGEADFTPISNTGLLYVSNSPNDIFMDIASQQYYVLLSGRWYRSPSLKSEWSFINADQLPKDFSRIPAGTEKDNVLASVAGTPAAKNALLDAQLPLTARVDRNKATASVSYDGDPEFERISGTKMSYAINSSATVIKYRNDYYLVENGVWFRSNYPSGPWAVSNTRPDEVDLIPPSYPVYNVKYVYIYETTPDYVYMGYTPGYLNNYVYGPTVVYGTGYYYRPWHRRRYFARPYTWGFNMHYTPWMGWTIGLGYHPGWFNVGYNYNPWGYWGGGWWGPSMYRPSYCSPFYRNNGYYGYNGNHFYVNNYNYYNYYGGRRSNNYYHNNIYHQRRDVVTVDNRRPANISRPVQNPDRRQYTGNYDGRYNNSNGYNNRNDGLGVDRNTNRGDRQSDVSRRVRESIPDINNQRDVRVENNNREIRPDRQYRPGSEPQQENRRQNYNQRNQEMERRVITRQPAPSGAPSRPAGVENRARNERSESPSPRIERSQITRPAAPPPSRRESANSNQGGSTRRPERNKN